MVQPILYSFRRCPYAMRARMALAYSGITYELREVVLKDKPKQLFDISPKGTVPVLLREGGQVIEESLDIMHWALQQADPEHWGLDTSNELIQRNDGQFKHYLDRYKYHDRYPEKPQAHYQEKALEFINELEQRLLTSNGNFLTGHKLSVLDVAILPFVRQFAFVDKHAFDHLPYSSVQQWLEEFLVSPLFINIMVKHTPWKNADVPIYLNID